MLTGRNAVIYRANISKVTIEELQKHINKEIIDMVETENGTYDEEVIRKYYKAVNKVKQDKGRNTQTTPDIISGDASGYVDNTAVGGDTPIEETPVPKKTARTRKTTKTNS